MPQRYFVADLFLLDYPDLEGDETRRAIWLHDVPLTVSHHLRSRINNGEVVPPEVLEKYEMPVIANVLKLYLLELPGKCCPQFHEQYLWSC